MHSVAEINVYRAAGAPEYPGALCFALVSMAGGILNAAVRLCFGYPEALFASVGKRAYKELSDKRGRKGQRVGAEKFTIEHHSTIRSV